ncbi:MAG: hypothetical protein V7K59_10030 [Nostoc sp.]
MGLNPVLNSYILPLLMSLFLQFSVGIARRTPTRKQATPRVSLSGEIKEWRNTRPHLVIGLYK